MNKGKLIFIVALLIVGAFFVSEYMSIGESGFTVTSITTSPHIITPDSKLNACNFLITTVFNAGGQSIVGYLSPSEIQQESGYETEYSLKIEAQAVNEVVDYPIVNQPNLRMYEYSLTVLETTMWNTNPACPVEENKDIFKEILLGGIISGRKYCIYEEDVGAIGYLDNPTMSFNTKISLTAHGETLTKELNSIDSRRVSFYDNSNLIATASWDGNLVTGNMPASEALYVATYRTDIDSAWHVTDKSKYGVYTTTLLDSRSEIRSLTCYLAGFEKCQTAIETEIDKINTKLESLSTGTEVGIGDMDTKINPNSLSKGELRATFNRRFSNPQVTFLVNAAWVGIKFGLGQPEIVSVNCPDFSSGDNIGVCDVRFKNAGEAEGSFIASFIPSAGSSFRQQYITTPVLLQPGEYTTVQIHISHGTAVEESSVGTIKVEDANDDTRFDTQRVSITMTQPKMCIPGAEEARGQSIYKCNAAGSGWDLIETCAKGTFPGLNDAKTHLECRELADAEPSEGGFMDLLSQLLKMLFGSDFELDDVIPLILLIIVAIVVLYIIALALPAVLSLLGKVLMGIIFRGK